MSAFEILHQDDVAGKLTCFDRLIFKGHIQRFYMPGALKAYVATQGGTLKYWNRYVTEASAQVKDHVLALAADAGAPYEYLGESFTRATGRTKEDKAREIRDRDGVTSGLVCVFGAVEPCNSFTVIKNEALNELQAVPKRRKCLQFYLYFMDDQLGFCHVKIQSWLPFTIQVWANGHDMLARALDKARIPYLRQDNCFYRIGNWARAQRLADKIGSRRWWRLLDHLAHLVNPHLDAIEASGFGSYYWVADQVEVASDVAFRTRPALEAVAPGLFAHAASAFSAEDVLRFLGRKMTPALAAEINTDARRRPEGWRIKHRMGRNHIKCYTRGPVLRVETTINDPYQFRVLRVVDGHRKWCPMQKGVANLYRYYQVGRSSDERYLEALGAAPDHRAGIVALERLCRPRTNQGRRHPRLSPLEGRDLALFRAVMAGEHVIVGFRNHHIQERLWKRPPADAADAKRRCAYVSRQLTKFRGHGLIAKVPRQRLYRVTPYGQRVMSAAVLIHDRDFPHAYEAA